MKGFKECTVCQGYGEIWDDVSDSKQATCLVSPPVREFNFTKKDVFDHRTSEEIDASKEPDLYLAKVAYDHYSSAVRDNSISELISLGRDIEAGDE